MNAPARFRLTRRGSAPRRVTWTSRPDAYGAGMYDELYDPDLHPNEPSTVGSTLTRVVAIGAVLSGGLLLYTVVTLIV